MMSSGDRTVALNRFQHGGIRTYHYSSLEAMLEDLLMNSGDKIPFLVRDKLLPPAIAAWELSIKQDNCDHDRKHGTCGKCGLEFDV